MTQTHKNIIVKNFDTSTANIEEANKLDTSKKRADVKKADKPDSGISRVNIKIYTN